MAQITVTGHLFDPSGTATAGSVTFQLANYGANIPRVIGTNAVVATFLSVTANASGAWTAQVQGNDTIDPGATNNPPTTYYNVSFKDVAGNTIQVLPFNFTGAGPANLDSQAPLNVVPSPTTPPNNAALLAANQTFTGNNTFQGTTTLGTVVGNANFTGSPIFSNTVAVTPTAAATATFGTNPTIDGSFVWNNSLYRMGGTLSKATDEGNLSEDEFILAIESTQAASNASVAAFKGPLFLDTVTNDPSTNSFLHSSNALTAYSHVGTGNTTSYAEGIVSLVDIPTFTLTSVANASGGSTVYTGTITGGGSNAFSGFTFFITGFTNGANNGSFACTASTTTTLTLSNAGGVAETHAATAASGDGNLIGAEIDVNNNSGTDAPALANADSNPITNKSKLNLYLGSGGSNKNSWVMFTGNTGPGWSGGIRLNNIASAGTALLIPNNTYISFRNAANNNDLIMLSSDTNNNVTLGSGAQSGVGIAKPIVSYNGIQTFGNGVPSEIATVDLTTQAANIGSTTLYAVPSTGVGLYRVSAYCEVTQAATVSSTLPQVQVNYTSRDASSAQGINLNATSAGNTLGTFSEQNVAGVISVKSSTTITYATAGYASSGATPMQYSLHIKLEAL